MIQNPARGLWGVVVCALTAVAPLATVQAQGNANQFGGQDRANAVSQMIVLGVQQGISSLPPTQGQSFVYRFNSEIGAFEPDERLGPVVFRSTETLGAGNLNLRFGTSYFELAQTFNPVQYLVNFSQPYQGFFAGVVGFGVNADAHVTVLNFSASYGLIDRVDLMFNLPVTVVDAHASQSSSTSITDAGLPASQAVVDGPFASQPIQGPADVDALSQEFNRLISPKCADGRDSCLTYRHDRFTSLGFNFNDGTHLGVGRMSVGGKALLYSNEWLRLAFMTEFFVPSPSQSEFAGPDTASILPRAVATVPIQDWLRFYTDVGYDYDFNESDLTRFVWDAGLSFPIGRFTFDAGMGGSKYDTPIRWTPTTATGAADPQQGLPSSRLNVLGNNQLGDNFIDFLGGVKARLTDQFVLNGAVTVPVNNEGFRPAALGTLALEYYFRAPPKVKE